jgi:predicted anti-sigma-YlaC factor YlaD
LRGCYELTHDIAAEEKALLAEQVRKAALIAHLSVIKALDTRKKRMRRKQLRRARKALVIVDAGLEIFLELKWVSRADVGETASHVGMAFQNIRRLRRKK